jgi:ATP-dependent Lhr-like helicase
MHRRVRPLVCLGQQCYREGQPPLVHSTCRLGGVRANAAIAQELESCLSQSVKHNAFSLVFDGTANMEEIENCINRLKSRDPDSLIPPVNIEAIDGLKFSECLPNDLAIRMLQERLKDVPAASHVLSQPVRYISLD